MDVVKPPEPLQLSGNLRRNWLQFKQKLELFLTATSSEKPRTEAVKAAILLSAAGDDALDVYNNFVFAEGESKDDYQTLVKKFDEYCVLQGNEVYERHVFRLRVQDEAEPFERYLRDLKKQAKLCNFGELEPSMIRDQVVFGIRNKQLRQRLLSEKDLTLQKADQICKAAEVSALQNASWSKETLQVEYTRRTEQRSKRQSRCRQCGRFHAPEDCPARGKFCYVCKKKNHFAAYCTSRKVDQVDDAREADDNFDILNIGVCGVADGTGADWTVRGEIAGQEFRFKVDTGSQANLLPLSVFRRANRATEPRRSTAVLTAYNGSIIKHVGVSTEVLKLNGQERRVTFFIVKKGRNAIIGLKACQEFGLIPTVNAVNASEQGSPQLAFPLLFQGTGCVKREYKMVLRPDAVPVVQPARRVPLAMKEQLREELNRMERAAIIVKVDEPTDWFIPGKDLLLADMLSRTATQPGGADEAEDMEVHAIQVVSNLVSSRTKQRLQEETRADPYLSSVVDQLKAGATIQGELKPFTSELSTVDGVLLKGSKIVVPKTMRAEILGRIHEGHMGQNKCKARARRLVFWPGLCSEIENLIRKCQVCQKYAYSQPSEPLLRRPTPKRPWYRVGIDLFQFAGDSYVVVYDEQSNFPDVERLVGTTAAETISKISAVFSRYGIPAQVCTDNGPQFSSSEFAAFAKRYDFEHVTSSPNFPRSNGLAEKGVQIVKRILKKTTEGREDFWLGLLAYRSSPLEDGRSPGELLQGRRLRSTVPEFNADGECPVSKHRQSLQGKPLSPLDAGNIVRIKNGNWSRKATVLKEVAPRSYLVKTENHRQLRRNRQQLLRTHERCANDYAYESGLEDYEPPDSVGPPVEGLEPRNGPDAAAAADPQSTRLPEDTEQTESPGHPSELTLRRSTRSRTEPKRLRYDENFHQLC